MLARVAQGEGVKRIARELGVDRKTVKRWKRLGQWQPRQGRPRPLDRYVDFLERRAPEVGWNGAVRSREVRGLGFPGGYLQVQRFLQSRRAERLWGAKATVRLDGSISPPPVATIGRPLTTRVRPGRGADRPRRRIFPLIFRPISRRYHIPERPRRRPR